MRFVLTTVTLCLATTCFAETPKGDRETAPPPPRVALVSFPTTGTVPAFDGGEAAERFAPMLHQLPEAQLVQMGLAFAVMSGELTKEQVDTVAPRLAGLYRRLDADEQWNRVPSPLPFCFVDRPRREGQYALVRPIDANADEDGVPSGPTVVFLHGFGGSFLANIYLLAEAMPDATIIAPSWPRSWADGPDWYLKQAIDDAETRLGRPLSGITLVGMSDGGKVVARYASRDRGRVERIVSLAMTMPKSDLARLPRDTPVLLVCGSHDQRVGIDQAREQGLWLGKRFAHASFVEVEGDHFFLLDPANDTLAQVAAFARAEHAVPAPDPR